MISRERLETVLGALPRMTIGLVGDLFLDRYLELVPGVHELSIETGLEAYQIDRIRNAPGALGTVMNNLAALGAGLLVPVTVIGDDGHGYELLREVRRLPVDLSQLMCVRDRLTPTYTKPMRPDGAGNWQELNRLDCRTRGPLNEGAMVELCGRAAQAFESSDGLIVLDQICEAEHGVVNHAVRETLAELMRQRTDKLVYIDSREHLGQFTFGVQKGNRTEILRAVGEPANSADAVVERAAQTLADRAGQPVFCTLGERGILVARPGDHAQLAPGFPAKGPVDIVGAGDAATSGIVSALLAGLDPLEAATFGNLVASITVQQLGTTGTASPAQLRQQWERCCA